MSLYDQLPEKSYIKKLLFGVEPAIVERFLEGKKKYETAQDKEDKRLYRDKLGSLFWELYMHVAKMINPEMGTAKRLFLRYGLVDLRHLSPEDQKAILAQDISPPNYDSEVIFYADEWLQGVMTGKIKASAGDETGGNAASATTSLAAISGKQEKFIALLRVEEQRCDEFKAQRAKQIETISTIVQNITPLHVDEETSYQGTFSKDQLKQLDDLLICHKELKKINKEIQASFRQMAKAQRNLDELQQSEDSQIHNTANPHLVALESEVGNIRQMAKMTIGRQGNPYPILSSSFINTGSEKYLFKAMVKEKLEKWMSLDPEVFMRTYKGDNMNIMPYMILVPSYGSSGVCWEALDQDNKQFGRGRIALPIFTRTGDLSLLTAMGDIRWQTAKEIASYYWMEEGLTGRYYEYYLEAKLKTDLRTTFITDYLLWMTKETQGVQKLEQNARYVFWRYVPLPEEDKIRLSKKGYYYTQLWEKEQVWRKSKDNK